MYVFKKDSKEVAALDLPVWVKLQPNNCYGLCSEADAQGIQFGGIVYSIEGKEVLPNTEVLTMSIVDSVPYLNEKISQQETKLQEQAEALAELSLLIASK